MAFVCAQTNNAGGAVFIAHCGISPPEQSARNRKKFKQVRPRLVRIAVGVGISPKQRKIVFGHARRLPRRKEPVEKETRG